MNIKSFLLCVIVACTSIIAQAQTTCYEDYDLAFKNQGADPVPDGMQNVVVGVKDSMGKADCFEGKILVSGGEIKLPLYVRRENGSFTEVHGKFDNNFYRNTIGEITFKIESGRSAMFVMKSRRNAKLFFVDYLKADPGKMVRAPEIKKPVAPPPPTDVEKISLSAKAIQFKTGKAVISKESYSTLDVIAELMKHSPETKWTIGGYTDDVGNDESNLKLSNDRANAVSDYLISKGILSDNLYAAGYGESNPIADNKTEEGRRLNRRVEIKPI